MTPPDRPTDLRAALLERILDTVDSIDRTVQEILERVSDHFDDTRYRSNWNNRGFDDSTDGE